MITQVSASILSADPTKLGHDLMRAEHSGITSFHIDIMDGHFVPNVTFGPHIIKALKSQTKLPFHVHLMVKDADHFIKMYADSADLIAIHPESSVHLHRSLSLIKELGKKTSLVLNPATPLAYLDPVLDMLDQVLIMSVNPGFGGQSFITESLKKITQVKTMIQATGKSIDLAVDGGINDKTALSVIEAGANVLISGSYLFSQSDMKAAVHSLLADGV